jgi:phosphoglycerate dehydrogenase-like enzyme
MVRIAVLDDYAENASDMADWGSIPGAEMTYFKEHVSEPDALVAMLQGFDVVQMMRERTQFPASVVERLPDLKLLSGTGGRHPHVDIDACARLGIPVTNTRGSSGVGPGGPTMELAWGLIIGLMRHIPWENSQMRAGNWQTRMGTSMGGKKLGIMGLGSIGVPMSTIANAFGMNVIAWSRSLTPERAEAAGATCVSFDELFAQSDVLTIHVPLSDESRGWVGARELGLMKPTAYLVNTSRGPIVQTDALVDALRANTIAGAAVDVYDEEPIAADHPLLALDNVVLTPHLGYASVEGLRNFYQGAVENIRGWVAGELSEGFVANKDVLGSERKP